MASSSAPRDGSDGANTSPPSLEYWIDGEDRILAVNEAYVADIHEHGPTCDDPAEHVHERLIGRVLWDVLPQAAEWYRPLVHLARAEAKAIAFAFRCDTPSLRRLMEMRIIAHDDGIVRFVSTLIGQQPRHAVALLQEGIPRGTMLVSMCSWCKRVRAGATWLEVEQALGRLGVSEAEPMPAVSHGICQSCKAQLVELGRSPEASMEIGLPSVER